MSATTRIQRRSFSYFLDVELDRKLQDLVNRGEYRSKSDITETALREYFERRDETAEKAAS